MGLPIHHRVRLLGACSALATALVLAIVTPSASAAPTISEFPITGGNGPREMTLGPDGNVWFVEAGANRIGKVTPAGVVTTFSAGLSSSAGLAGITAGPDGNLWFTESSKDRIGRINPTTGVITEFTAGINGGSDPHGIVAGPDGALWFTEMADDEIGRITTGGLVTEFSVPGSGNNPYGITAGPDGNLWFTELTGAGGIGRITPAGSVTEFGPMTVGLPAGIVAGPDGNLWFAASEDPGAIGRITTSGTITQYSSGLTTNGSPLDMVVGDDGNLYFTENAGAGRIGQITTAGAITEFSAGLTAASAPWGIANGADGNIWFTETAGNRVGRLNFAPGVVTDPATQIHASDATLAGTVTPRSQTTTYSFDWGLTAGYGSSTATFSAGSGASAQSVTAFISGLEPATTYHFRVVATNAAGTTLGADRTFTTVAPAPFALPVTLPPPDVTPSLPPATRPVLGKSATIAATSGEILVQLPGTGIYLPLLAASTVPVGTTIDATRGRLKLTNIRNSSGKLQTGSFWGGAFTFRQTRGKQATTVLTLAAPMSCSRSRLHLASATAGKRTRQLWGKDNNGRFVTRGRSAVATVRGTAWFTRDTCAGTLVSVTHGTVAVRDLVRKVTVIVRAGHKYLARVR
jgi:streptogramin lyase